MTRKPKRHVLKRIISPVLAVLSVLICIGAPLPVLAASQSFTLSGGQPENGLIMSLSTNPSIVRPATTQTASSMVGVIAPNTSNVTEQTDQINVQTSGVAQVLVSTLDGAISAGDRITTSAIQGVGMKQNGSGWVLGTAQSSFSSTSKGAYQTSLTDSSGVSHQVSVGLIPVVISVSYYSSATSTATSQSLSSSSTLQRLANSVGGKTVSTKTVVFALSVFFVGIVLAATIIITAIRSSFAAIARQPLSRSSILRAEWRSIASALVLLIGVIGVSLIILRYA